MDQENKKNSTGKPGIDEEYLMNIISGDQSAKASGTTDGTQEKSQARPKEKNRGNMVKKPEYEQAFLVNRFPSGRSGKVVYIRPEYHERLIRIVQLTRDEKTTLYSYIDNILEYHFMEFGEEITNYFNERFKPIL